MPRYRVYPYATVSTMREVEADSAADAADKVLDDDVPELMFLDHTYPDVSEWEIDDEDTEELS